MSEKICSIRKCHHYKPGMKGSCNFLLPVDCFLRKELEPIIAERDALKGELAVKDRALELSVQDVVARKTCPNQADKCPLEPSWSDCIKCHATYHINQAKETPCES